MSLLKIFAERFIELAENFFAEKFLELAENFCRKIFRACLKIFS